MYFLLYNAVNVHDFKPGIVCTLFYFPIKGVDRFYIVVMECYNHLLCHTQLKQ